MNNKIININMYRDIPDVLESDYDFNTSKNNLSVPIYCTCEEKVKVYNKFCSNCGGKLKFIKNEVDEKFPIITSIGNYFQIFVNEYNNIKIMTKMYEVYYYIKDNMWLSDTSEELRANRFMLFNNRVKYNSKVSSYNTLINNLKPVFLKDIKDVCLSVIDLNKINWIYGFERRLSYNKFTDEFIDIFNILGVNYDKLRI